MTRKPQRIILWISSIILILGFLTGLFFWSYSKVPSLAQQFPQNQTPLSISIISPDNKSSWPADAFVPVQVTIQSETELKILELWVDGTLVESIQPEQSGQFISTHLFRWLPFVTGGHRLLIRAQDQTGHIAVSNILNLTAAEPTGFGIVPIGSTPAEELQHVDLLPSGFGGNVPESFTPPVENPELPGVQNHAPNNFALWLGSYFSADQTLPGIPVLSVKIEGCSVFLSIHDKSDNELGYFIYRSTPGSSSFERIATIGLIALDTFYIYSDLDQKGPLDYYAAAFNTAGESPSAPVQVHFSDPECQANSLFAEESGKGELTVPETLNLAYFYFAYNRGGYQRMPSDPEGFLNPTIHQFSFDSLIENLVKSAPYPVSELDLVLWGWEGDELVNLGSWHTLVDRSDLTICNLGTNCTGDVAKNYRSTFGEIASNVENQLREFYWTTTAQTTTAVLWQISTKPFSANFQPHPTGLVAAGCTEGSGNGSFLVDFADLNAYLPGPSGCGESQIAFDLGSAYAIENYLPKHIGKTYYARFTPMAGNQPSGDPSNVVEIVYRPGEDIIEPVIVDHLPLIYQVEIIDFTPIKYMDFNYWGCVSIESLDYDQIWQSFKTSLGSVWQDQQITFITDQLYQRLEEVMANNQIVCPTSYQGGDDDSVLSEWGSSLMEGLNAFWESVNSLIETLKDTAVNITAGVINALGIPCDATCRAALRAGFEIAFTYFTGLPPSLPSFQELADEGINYAIQLAAAEAGIPCPEECQDALRSGLKEVLDLAIQAESQPACVDEDWAHLLGKNAFCFPSGVETKPVPEGVTDPASAVVKITRPENTTGAPTPDYKYYDMPSYVLSLQVSGTNDQAAGKTYTYFYSYYQKSLLQSAGEGLPETGISLDNFYQSSSTPESFILSVTPSEVAGQVFQTQSIPIPPLTPGESFTIPMTLGQESYYFREHILGLRSELNARGLDVVDVGGIDGHRGVIFDWGCLYQGGLLKIEAEVLCLSVPSGLIGNTSPAEDSILVPCGAEAVPVFHQETSQPCQP